MADEITYPNYGYGIMPNDAFNKYMRFQNQRRATTGMGATPSDQKAFWEGTMESVAKGASTRAAQSLEQKRLDASINYQNRQIEQTDKASQRSMYAGLAQFPMTYLMYDALGIGRQKGEKSTIGKAADWTGGLFSNLFGKKPMLEGVPSPESYSTGMQNLSYGGFETPSPLNPQGSMDSGILGYSYGEPGTADHLPSLEDFSMMDFGFDMSPVTDAVSSVPAIWDWDGWPLD